MAAPHPVQSQQQMANGMNMMMMQLMMKLMQVILEILVRVKDKGSI